MRNMRYPKAILNKDRRRIIDEEKLYNITGSTIVVGNRNFDHIKPRSYGTFAGKAVELPNIADYEIVIDEHGILCLLVKIKET